LRHQRLSLMQDFQGVSAVWADKSGLFITRWIVRYIRKSDPAAFEGLQKRVEHCIVNNKRGWGKERIIEARRIELQLLSRFCSHAPFTVTKLPAELQICYNAVIERSHTVVNFIQNDPVFQSYYKWIEPMRKRIREQPRHLYQNIDDAVSLSWILYMLAQEDPGYVRRLILLYPVLCSDSLNSVDELVMEHQETLEKLSRGDWQVLKGHDKQGRRVIQALFQFGRIPEIKDAFEAFLQWDSPQRWPMAEKYYYRSYYLKKLMPSLSPQAVEKIIRDYPLLPSVHMRLRIDNDAERKLQEERAFINTLHELAGSPDKALRPGTTERRAYDALLQHPHVTVMIARTRERFDHGKDFSLLCSIFSDSHRSWMQQLIGDAKKKTLVAIVRHEYPDTRKRLELEYPRAILMAASITNHGEYIRYLNKQERSAYGLKYVDIQTRHRQEVHSLLCLMPSLVHKVLASIEKRVVRHWSREQVLYLCGLWRLRHALPAALQQRIEGSLFGHPRDVYQSWKERFKEEPMIEGICKEQERRSFEEALLRDHENVSGVFSEALLRLKAPQEIKAEEYYGLVRVPLVCRQWQERAEDFTRRFGVSQDITALRHDLDEALRAWDSEIISLERDKEIIRKFRERAEMVYDQLCTHAAYVNTDGTARALLRKRKAKRLKLMEDLLPDAVMLVTPFMQGVFLNEVETLTQRIKSVKAEDFPGAAFSSSAPAEEKEQGALWDDHMQPISIEDTRQKVAENPRPLIRGAR